LLWCESYENKEYEKKDRLTQVVVAIHNFNNHNKVSNRESITENPEYPLRIATRRYNIFLDL